MSGRGRKRLSESGVEQKVAEGNGEESELNGHS